MGGGHGHGHSHGDPYVIPDPKIYRVEAPELLEVRNALARLGLKDPWLRNEAWRYDKMHGTHATRARTFFLRGFPLGLGLAILTAGLGYISEQGEHDEHGGHGGHGGHH